MSINLTTLFTRLGHIGAIINSNNSYANTTLPTAMNTLAASYSGNDQAAIDGWESVQQSIQNNTGSGLFQLQSFAVNTVNLMVQDDNPQFSNTDIEAALNEVRRQMVSQGQTVRSCTITSTVATGGNQGNGLCLCSVKRFDGKTQENILPETITLRCTSDQDTGSTAGNEGFTITGQEAVDPLSYLFPKGTSANSSLNVIDGTQDNASGNLLTNGSFTSFTSNVPNNWSILVGTPGSTVKQNTNQSFSTPTGSSLEFVGNGSELTSIEQTFDSSSGSSDALTAFTQYAVVGYAKLSAVPTGGILSVDLVDQNTATINDQAGTANSFTTTLHTLGTGWSSFSGIIRTPQVMPNAFNLRVRLSTALDNGVSLYIDQLALGQMTALDGGPSLAIFNGSTDFYNGDYFTATLTNDFAASSQQKTFQVLFNRLFTMTSLTQLGLPNGSGILLPSLATGWTIQDSLIA